MSVLMPKPPIRSVTNTGLLGLDACLGGCDLGTSCLLYLVALLHLSLFFRFVVLV
jgi:hypothetical protein